MGKSAKSPIFYGWYVLFSAFLILFWVQGARTVIGVMFKPVIAELSLSRSALSLAAFINMAVFASTLTIIGTYYDRYGAKRVLIISSLFLALGYIGIARVHSIWSFILLYGILAALGFGGTSIPLFAALIGKWFSRYRGLAISLAIAGGCLGQFVLVPLASQFVTAFGWRISFAIIGAAILGVNLPLIHFLIKEKPEDMNLKPYGLNAAQRQNSDVSISAADIDRPDSGLRDAMHTSSFWLYLTVMFICGGGDYLVITHFIPMATDSGISALTAGRMLGLAGIFSFIGVLAAGPAVDRWGNKKPVMATFILRVIVFLMICIYQTLLSYYIFAAAFGFTMLITAPITTTLVGRLYGFTYVGVITGFITTVHHFSGGLWAWLGGIIYDGFGSYQLAFAISSLLALIASVCAMLITEEKHTLAPEGMR
jgi:MFS family permease